MIRIWQRDPVRGAVEVHDVPVATERRMQLGEFALFIDVGAEQQLRDMRTKGFPNETGGVLLGYYDFNISAVVIVAGLPPPQTASLTPAPSSAALLASRKRSPRPPATPLALSATSVNGTATRRDIPPHPAETTLCNSFTWPWGWPTMASPPFSSSSVNTTCKSCRVR